VVAPPVQALFSQSGTATQGDFSVCDPLYFLHAAATAVTTSVVLIFCIILKM